ncbi:MAG: OmpA family protein [Rickettsiales bacterium]|jgi:outer membrane protein OmpA-like peptidoglycan-associated protein|nr:OmpA family protein [Rickettsiales bacterium]
MALKHSPCGGQDDFLAGKTRSSGMTALAVVVMLAVLGQCHLPEELGENFPPREEDNIPGKDISEKPIVDDRYYTGKNEEQEDIRSILGEKYHNYSDVLEKHGDLKSSRYFEALSEKTKDGDLGAKFKSQDLLVGTPEQLADLYFLFNCWFYFETENKNLGEAAICKNSFLRLSRHLKINGGDSGKIINAEKSSGVNLTREEEAVFIEFIKNGSIDILFDYDSYKLNPTAVGKIGFLLKYLNSIKSDYRIAVIGHADRSGKPIYNNTMARRRANSVFNILVKNGVPQDLISVQGVGSRSPKIITRSGARNVFNRRVEIIVDINYRNQDFQQEPQIVNRPDATPVPAKTPELENGVVPKTKEI